MSAIYKIKFKKVPSILNNKHKIRSPNYQNTTGSDETPGSIIHQK